jgi:hypothetical protein
MLIVADKAFFDAKMIQKFQGYTGILCSDKIRVLQRFAAALGDITQIANGGRYQI